MGLMTALRLNMTNVDDPTADHSERYRAALDMAEYADEHGFTGVSCEEHHLASTGWLPSPLVMAAALAARTRTHPYQHQRATGALIRSAPVGRGCRRLG